MIELIQMILNQNSKWNNNNNNRPLPSRNNNYQNDNRDYSKTPYEENNYSTMTPINHGYNYNRNEEYNKLPSDYYSEPGKYQNMWNYFGRQNNYMGNKTLNNYEDYKNQDYYKSLILFIN